jgi:hypothetical protein
MADRPQQLDVMDPDSIPETLCDGPFNVSIAGPLAYLTFTQMRPEIRPLFSGTINPKPVVRARIVTPIANLHALREMLNKLAESQAPAPSTGGSTHH